MYIKNIQDSLEKKERASVFGRFRDVISSDRSIMLRDIEMLAKACGLKIASADDAGNKFSLKNLSDQELQSIIRLLSKINGKMKGVDSGAYFGQLMFGDGSRIDESFYVEVNAKDLYLQSKKYDDEVSKYRSMLEDFSKKYNAEIEASENEIKHLKMEVDVFKTQSDKRKEDLEAVIKNIDQANKLLRPLVSVEIKRLNNEKKDLVISFDRSNLDKEIENYKNDLSQKRKELAELKEKISREYLSKTNKALDLINEYADREPPQFINGNVVTKDPVIDEILEKVKNLLNKKIRFISLQSQELGDLRTKLDEQQTFIEELREKIFQKDKKIELLELDNGKAREKRERERKLKANLDLSLLDLQRGLQTQGIDILLNRDPDNSIIELSFKADRLNNARDKELQAKKSIMEILSQIKDKAAQFGIELEVILGSDNKYRLMWNAAKLTAQVHELNKKIEDQELENKSWVKKYAEAKQDKETVENAKNELKEKLVKLEHEQQTLNLEIDSIYGEILKYEKDMNRARLEETMNEEDYAKNFKTKKAKKLGEKLSNLLNEKRKLKKEIIDYTERILNYEKQLAGLGLIITRSLLLTYYVKTSDVFERLTGNNLKFSPESRQMLAVHLCANADKKSDVSVRTKIYEFVTDRKNKNAAQVTKWLEEQVFPGAFKVSSLAGENIIKVECSDKHGELVLLPAGEWENISSSENEYFPLIVFSELMPILGVVYKNNENNVLVGKIIDKLHLVFNKKYSKVNESLQNILKPLLLENNMIKKYELLNNWWVENVLNSCFTVGKDFENKSIFVNYNPRTSDGFGRSMKENNDLFEVFMEKYGLSYDYLIRFLPKQFLYYDEDLQKLLIETASKSYNTNAKNKFYQIFKENRLSLENKYYDKSPSALDQYINYGYIAVSFIVMFFWVWPTILLQSTFGLFGAMGIFASFPLYALSLYGVFRKTGLIKLSWAERQEKHFYEKLYNEFTSVISKQMDPKKIVLDFQYQVPFFLLNERERYVSCMTGLLKYFLPHSLHRSISSKFMQENWEDLVNSLMYGSLEGSMGGIPLSGERLHKISELMCMLVILDIMINNHKKPLEGFMKKIQKYYGLKGR